MRADNHMITPFTMRASFTVLCKCSAVQRKSEERLRGKVSARLRFDPHFRRLRGKVSARLRFDPHFRWHVEGAAPTRDTLTSLCRFRHPQSMAAPVSASRLHGGVSHACRTWRHRPLSQPDIQYASLSFLAFQAVGFY